MGDYVRDEKHGMWLLRKPLIFASALAVVLLGTASCGFGGSDGEGGDSAGGAGGTRTDEGGSVTVKATWDGNLRPAKFQIALDTHSADLDSYDLSELVVLRVDGGADLAPVSSDAPKGGHHREGTLTFDWSPPSGAGGSSRLELVVRGVGDKAERVLLWETAE